MISYELALELKNAGFPQKYCKTKLLFDFAYDEVGNLHLLHLDNDTGDLIGNDYTTWRNGDSDELELHVKNNFCKHPTLSELIEACGDLEHIEIYKSKNSKWCAITENITVYGSTPEEAVANLWLALNKK